VLEPGVEALMLRPVGRTVLGDLRQNAAIAELEADGQILTEVLGRTDAGVQPVLRLLGREVG